MIPYKSSLFKVDPQAIAVDIGTIININPVFDNVTELEVVALFTKVSIVFVIVDSSLYFSNIFSHLWFSSLK